MPLLTILITTYNRAIVLEEVLKMLASYQKRGLAFDVLVSDDCSSDSTLEVCRKWEHELQGFTALKTEHNLGMDNNFLNAYKHFKTDYCWLLGDTRRISYEGLKYVIDTLSTGNYDALILRCREEMPHEQLVYTDINTLMNEQGWHITNNASCVIPRRFIAPTLYHRYMGTTFLHMGIFVENLCMVDHFRVMFMGNVDIMEFDVPGFNKIGWTKHPFLNFGKLWYEFVMSLPNQIDINMKHKVLQDHDRYTHLFALSEVHREILTHREVFINSYKENRRFMPFVTSRPIWMMDLLIGVLPLRFYTTIFAIYKFLFKRNKSI